MNPEVHVPGWEWWYVATYFFIGGISAGAYFIGSLAELFGGERYRALSRTAYYVAFPLILLTPPLLILDLGRPGRFWHLLLFANSGVPYVNLQSPLSVGSWALLVFGAMSLLSFLDNLVAEGRLKGAPLAHLYSGLPRKVYAAVGSVAGFFVAGYTGVVLNVTARPFWVATDPLVGALFIASAASTGAAAIALVDASRRGAPEVPREAFERFDRIVKGIELVLAIAVVAVAGKYAAPLLSGLYALAYWGGAVVLGIVLPLAWAWGAAPLRAASGVRMMPALVLLGGALLRIALVQAGQVQ